jgi:hypothetical protein
VSSLAAVMLSASVRDTEEGTEDRAISSNVIFLRERERKRGREKCKRGK